MPNPAPLIGGLDPGVVGALCFVRAIPYEFLGGISWDLRGLPKKHLAVELDGIVDVAIGLVDRPPVIATERVFASQISGASSMLSFGRATGGAEASLTARGCTIVYYEPSAWKRQMGLSNNKREAITLANKFGNVGTRLKDQHAAEALLLAVHHAFVLAHKQVWPEMKRYIGIFS